jgi:hypothetical protein
LGNCTVLVERRHEADDITFDQLNFAFKNVYGFADSCQPISDKDHEGEYAAAGLAKHLSEFEILEKISRPPSALLDLRRLFSLYLSALTLDNHPVNDVLVRALSKILREKFDVQFVPDNSQIRCLAHVVNLVV